MYLGNKMDYIENLNIYLRNNHDMTIYLMHNNEDIVGGTFGTMNYLYSLPNNKYWEENIMNFVRWILFKEQYTTKY